MELSLRVPRLQPLCGRSRLPRTCQIRVSWAAKRDVFGRVLIGRRSIRSQDRLSKQSELSGLYRQDVGARTICVDDAKSTGRLYYPSPVFASLRRSVLRVTIGTEKAQIGRAIIRIDPIPVLKNERERFSVPQQLIGVISALLVVTAFWDGRDLLFPPTKKMCTCCSIAALTARVAKRINVPSSDLPTHGVFGISQKLFISAGTDGRRHP
jgi:hypothetical protein